LKISLVCSGACSLVNAFSIFIFVKFLSYKII
jgi:hypothetical protein